MKTFRKDISRELKNPVFRKAYEREGRLIDILMSVKKAREQKHISQTLLAKKAGVTQKMIYQVENGLSCNVTTLDKIASALDLKIALLPVGRH